MKNNGMTKRMIRQEMAEIVLSLKSGKMKIGEVNAIANCAKVALGTFVDDTNLAKALADKKVKAEYIALQKLD